MLIKYFKQMDHTWKHSQHVNSVPSLVTVKQMYYMNLLNWVVLNGCLLMTLYGNYGWWR